jgi:hypothetical protein
MRSKVGSKVATDWQDQPLSYKRQVRVDLVTRLKFGASADGEPKLHEWRLIGSSSNCCELIEPAVRPVQLLQPNQFRLIKGSC